MIYELFIESKVVNTMLNYIQLLMDLDDLELTSYINHIHQIAAKENQVRLKFVLLRYEIIKLNFRILS